jgi:AcrR family transcriptional regulator
MKIIKQDRRTQKSHSAISAAFIALLHERSYESLTVSDVAARANVGRSTLYEHFRTKRDLLRASLTEPLAKLASTVDPKISNDLLLPLLMHFRQNRHLARMLLTWPTRPLLAQSLADLILIRLKEMTRDLVSPIIPLEMITTQIAHAQLALIERWLFDTKYCGDEALATALTKSSQSLVTALYFRID